MKKLIKQYEDICNKIVNEFSRKQDIEFDGWVAGYVGGIACFIGQYYFSLDDLILDLKTNQEKWFILQWHDDEMGAGSYNINYNSYIKGLRHKDLKK